MARPIRVEFAGAVYHVMARGNERRPIFLDDQDRRRFLETLEGMVEQFGVRLHAYCLMTNHYHLLAETPRANLSQAMGWLQVTYTVRFNRRHRRSGQSVSRAVQGTTSRSRRLRPGVDPVRASEPGAAPAQDRAVADASSG